jgi:DNA replication protein DnaC
MTTDPRVDLLRYREFQLPTKYYRAPDGYHLSPKAKGFVLNLHDRLVTPSRPLDKWPVDPSTVGKGVVWVGPPGRGKTTEAVETLKSVYHTYSIPVFFVAFADYISLRKEQWGIEDRPEMAERWSEIQTIRDKVLGSPVLLLDDVGKEHDGRSRFAAAELDSLLRERHRAARPTLLTTNLPRNEWGRAYNPSMGSFVNEAFDWIIMNGKDHRSE